MHAHSGCSCSCTELQSSSPTLSMLTCFKRVYRRRHRSTGRDAVGKPPTSPETDQSHVAEPSAFLQWTLWRTANPGALSGFKWSRTSAWSVCRVVACPGGCWTGCASIFGSVYSSTPTGTYRCVRERIRFWILDPTCSNLEPVLINLQTLSPLSTLA